MHRYALNLFNLYTRIGRHSNILEPFIRETAFERFVARALQNVAVLLTEVDRLVVERGVIRIGDLESHFRRVQIGNQLWIGRQLAILDRHPCSDRATHLYPSPTRNVATEIVHLAILSLIDLTNRSNRLETTYWRHHLGPQRTTARNDSNRFPIRIVVGRRAPPLSVEPGIIQLALTRIIENDRTTDRFPTSVRHHTRCRTVRIFDPELSNSLGLSDPPRLIQPPYIVT